MSRATLEERVAELEKHVGALLAGSSGAGRTMDERDARHERLPGLPTPALTTERSRRRHSVGAMLALPRA